VTDRRTAGLSVMRHGMVQTVWRLCDVVVVRCRLGIDAHQPILRVLGTSTPAVWPVWVRRYNEERKFWLLFQWNSR